MAHVSTRVVYSSKGFIMKIDITQPPPPPKINKKYTFKAPYQPDINLSCIFKLLFILWAIRGHQRGLF